MNIQKPVWPPPLGGGLLQGFLACQKKRETERNKSAIYRAILKYGLSGFSFEIIEQCGPSILIEREQYYIDLIGPEYNILKFAANRQGFIHSEATKELQRKARLGAVLSEITKLKMSNSNRKSTPITVHNKEINEGTPPMSCLLDTTRHMSFQL
jgi:group I intron endonuclease